MTIDTNGVKLGDRPVEQVREEVIDQLIMNYSHGVISAEAFERRLDEAIDSGDHQVLAELVSDLTLQPDAQYQAMRERSFAPNYPGRAADSGDREADQRVVSVLSSSQRSGQWLVPAELSVLNVLGSVELDFSDAVFQHQHVTIRVANWLGSLDVKVTEQMNVVSDMHNVIGSVENKAPSIAGRQAPTISIEGYSVLGSVDVGLKRTLKEKFIAMADSFREAFGLNEQAR